MADTFDYQKGFKAEVAKPIMAVSGAVEKKKYHSNPGKIF